MADVDRSWQEDEESAMQAWREADDAATQAWRAYKEHQDNCPEWLAFKAAVKARDSIAYTRRRG